MKKFLTVLGAMLILTISFSYAQEQSGQLFGTVTDDEKAPLPGVTVEGTSPRLMGMVTAVTDEMGRFRLINLTPGTYTMVFKISGFATLRREGIVVSLGRTYYLNVSLNPAVIEEEITVIGESPMVDIKASGTTMEITKEMFNKLPKGRDFTTVVGFASGVNDEIELRGSSGTGLSMDGATSSENTFFVDGVNTTNLFTGDAAQQVVFEFIDEVQVKSSGYEAEYGGSMGGVVNVITRSGGNEFHGELMAYYNGSGTNGAYNGSPAQDGSGAYKILRRNPLDNTIGEHVTYPEDSWSNYEFGFGIGGYVIKDKLWFFGSFLPTIRTTDRAAEFTEDPTANATFTNKKTWLRASAKITAQLAALRLSASFSMDPYKWRGELPALDGSGSAAKEWADYGYDYPGITFSGRADYIASDNLFFSASGGYFRTNTKQLIGPTGPRHYFLRTNAGIAGVTPDLERSLYWAEYGYYDGYQTQFNIQDRLTASVDGTFYADFGGEHVFKAGVQFERIHHNADDAYPFNYYRLYWGDDYDSPQLGLQQTTLGYLDVRWPFGVVAEKNSNRWAVFLQDSWTVGRKLTLNFGLRLEKEEIPSYAGEEVIAAGKLEDPPQDYGKAPVAFDFFEKMAPRFGFAYDVFGDSTLKFFGSIGIYYDVMKLEMAEGSYGGFVWLSSYYDLTTVDWTTFTQMDHPITDGSFLPYYETRNWRIPSYGTTQPDTGPDKMKPYSKIEYTFGVQKKLGEDVSLTARFLHNRILWAIEDIGIETAEGETYYNGNPGSDWINDLYESDLGPEIPDCPKAQRKYYSIDVGLDKRFSNNWMGGVHYTWSYLWGNFAGLGSSDEQGRKSPNVERYFDAWFLHRTQDLKESTGKLPTDRPHSLKVYGAYTFDFGLTVGSYFFAQQGTPKNLAFELNWLQGYYPIGRGTEGRNPLLWRVDVYAEYNIKLTDKYAFQINLNVQNLFMSHIATRVFPYINQEVLYLDDDELLAGYDYLEVMTEQDTLLDPRFMKDRSFQAPITARIGVKFLF